HHLHVAWADHGAGADAVLVLQRPFQNIGDDLHIAVSVGIEAAAGAYAIFVDHAQRTEAHVFRIVVMAEREGMTAIQPPKIVAPALLGMSHLDHGNPQSFASRPLNIGVPARATIS